MDRGIDALMNFFTKVILGTVVVLVAAVTVVLVFRGRDAARLEALVREAAEWVRQGDAERVAALVDEKFEGNRAEEARIRIREYIKRETFAKLEIVSIKVDIEGDEASVKVGYKMPIPSHLLPEMRIADMPPRNYESTLRWRRRAEGWKVFGYDGPMNLR